jgi:hypothetical protein
MHDERVAMADAAGLDAHANVTSARLLHGDVYEL